MKKRVLIADDEIEITTLVSEHFDDNGHETTVVNDLELCRQELKENDFDVVIIDFKFEVENSAETIFNILSSKSNTPAVFLITGSMSEEKIKRLAPYVKEIIQKPFLVNDLLLRVES